MDGRTDSATNGRRGDGTAATVSTILLQRQQRPQHRLTAAASTEVPPEVRQSEAKGARIHRADGAAASAAAAVEGEENGGEDE